MGQCRGPLHGRQLATRDASVALPEGLYLFQQHGANLIARPSGSPGVFVHNEIILPIVFTVNENYSILLLELRNPVLS